MNAKRIEILTANDDELMQISERGLLSLNLVEMKAIQNYFTSLGRNPIDVELVSVKEIQMISIVLTVYNPYNRMVSCLGSKEKTTLHYCLASLVSQDTENYELIVIDDGSTEPVIPILEWAIDHGLGVPIFYTRKERMGVGSHPGMNRNLGFLGSHTSKVLICDQDLMLHSDYVRLHTQELDKDGFVQARYKPTKAALPPVEKLFEVGAELFVPKEQVVYTSPFTKGYQITATGVLSVRRSAYMEVGGMDTRYIGWGAGGIDLTYRLIQLGYRQVCPEHLFVYHIEHPPQLGKKEAKVRNNKLLASRMKSGSTYFNLENRAEWCRWGIEESESIFKGLKWQSFNTTLDEV